LVMHPTLARNLTIRPLRPLIIPEQHHRRPALVRIGPPHPMGTVRAHTVKDRVTLATLMHLGVNLADPGLTSGGYPVEAIGKPVRLTVEVHHHWRERSPGLHGLDVLGYDLGIDRFTGLGASIGPDTGKLNAHDRKALVDQ